MVFYMDLYRKCDFLCEGCIEFYYDRRRQEMLGIQEIVSIEEYNATHKPFCDKCELYEWNHTLLKMEIIIYYVMDVLSSSEQRNGWYKRYREGMIVNHSLSQIFNQSFCSLYHLL